MSELQTLGVTRLLHSQPGLRLRPSAGEAHVLVGTFHLNATYDQRTIEDEFRLEFRLFPDPMDHQPEVRELGDRIPVAFHTLVGGALCVGSPMRIREVLAGTQPIWRYVEHLLIPYLYGFCHRERFGTMPYGELDHGVAGLLDDYRRLFGFATDPACREALRLLALKKRIANKSPCPCGSGRRLGRCHHLRLNRLRERHGRSWFAGQARAVAAAKRLARSRWHPPPIGTIRLPSPAPAFARRTVHSSHEPPPVLGMA